MPNKYRGIISIPILVKETRPLTLKKKTKRNTSLSIPRFMRRCDKKPPMENPHVPKLSTHGDVYQLELKNKLSTNFVYGNWLGKLACFFILKLKPLSLNPSFYKQINLQ